MEELWSEVLKEGHKKLKAWKHSTKEEKGAFVSKGWKLFIWIVCLHSQNWLNKNSAYCCFTLILSRAEVKTKQEEDPRSLIVPARDTFFTPVASSSKHMCFGFPVCIYIYIYKSLHKLLSYIPTQTF